MKGKLTIWICIACFQFLFAQEGINGLWKGTLTHDQEGYDIEYTFEMYLFQKDTKIHGRSYIYVDDIFAVMELEGEIHSGILFRFQEVEKLDSKAKMGMEWCLKRGQLILTKDQGGKQLKGHWQGETSFSSCVPGKIMLRKIHPQA